jgi:hypothetical protein
VVDDKRVGRARPQPIGRVAEATPPPAPPAGPKTDYLALLRADYDKRLVELTTGLGRAATRICREHRDILRDDGQPDLTESAVATTVVAEGRWTRSRTSSEPSRDVEPLAGFEPATCGS